MLGRETSELVKYTEEEAPKSGKGSWKASWRRQDVVCAVFSYKEELAKVAERAFRAEEQARAKAWTHKADNVLRKPGSSGGKGVGRLRHN